MTSWAVVCDVYFLEPQKKGEDESAQQFAERVQRLIAERAKLQIAPWDGYLKYYTLGVKVSVWVAPCRQPISAKVGAFGLLQVLHPGPQGKLRAASVPCTGLPGTHVQGKGRLCLQVLC